MNIYTYFDTLYTKRMMTLHRLTFFLRWKSSILPLLAWRSWRQWWKVFSFILSVSDISDLIYSPVGISNIFSIRYTVIDGQFIELEDWKSSRRGFILSYPRQIFRSLLVVQKSIFKILNNRSSYERMQKTGCWSSYEWRSKNFLNSFLVQLYYMLQEKSQLLWEMNLLVYYQKQ